MSGTGYSRSEENGTHDAGDSVDHKENNTTGFNTSNEVTTIKGTEIKVDEISISYIYITLKVINIIKYQNVVIPPSPQWDRSRN